MTVHAVVKNVAAHRERLARMVVDVRAQGTISLNLATFLAKRRTGHEVAQGCLIGHWVATTKPRHLELVPLNFLEQVKSPLLAHRLFDSLPNADWRHHTLHYHGPDIEAWGMNAACLYFQLNKWDVQTLFWPAGYNNQLAVDSELVLAKLERFLSVDHVINHDNAAQ